MAHERKLSGDVDATGRGDVGIDLFGSRPHKINVFFVNEHEHHGSCNPHRDKVEWQLRLKGPRYILFIKWNVEGFRRIRWVVEYKQ